MPKSALLFIGGRTSHEDQNLGEGEIYIVWVSRTIPVKGNNNYTGATGKITVY